MSEIDPSIFKQKAPCSDCPFRRDGGVRHGPRAMAEYIQYFVGFPGTTFPCHKSVPRDIPRDRWTDWQEGQVLCAGGVIFGLKNGCANAVTQIGFETGALRFKQYAPADVAAVFDTVTEALNAQRREP